MTLGERKAFLMRSVKSAFALLLARVTEPPAGGFDRQKGDNHETNNQRHGWQRLGEPQQQSIQG